MKIPVSLIIFAAIVLGLLFPKGVMLKDFTFPLLFVLMYFSVLQIKLSPKKFFRKEIIFWALVNVIVLPLFAYFIGSSLSEYLLLGVVVAALAPTAVNSPFFVNLIDGDKEMSVSISAIANLTSIFYIPFVLFLLFGLRLTIPYQQILTNIFGLVFIPLFLVVLTKKLLKKTYAKIINYSNNIIPIVLFLILWIIFSSSSSQIFSFSREVLSIIPIILLVSILGFFSGFIVVKDKKLRRTLSICFGYKNQTLMLGIIYNINPLAAIPPTIYLVVHQILNGLMVWLFEKKKI